MALYIYMLRLFIMNVSSVIKIRWGGGDFKQKQKKSETFSKWNFPNGRNYKKILKAVHSCTCSVCFDALLPCLDLLLHKLSCSLWSSFSFYYMILQFMFLNDICCNNFYPMFLILYMKLNLWRHFRVLVRSLHRLTEVHDIRRALRVSILLLTLVQVVLASTLRRYMGYHESFPVIFFRPSRKIPR
jgi:hypothetical protein